jgi:hypothetical protein
MCRRRQQDLLGLLIGALEDREQREIAEKCREDARLNRHLMRWRKRLKPLELFASAKVDPPPGLAERTYQFIFSRIDLLSPGPAPDPVGLPSGETSGYCDHEVGTFNAVACLGVPNSANLPFWSVPAGEGPSGPFFIPARDPQGRLSSESGSPGKGGGKERDRSRPTPGSGRKFIRDLAPVAGRSSAAADTPLAGVVSEAGWWRMILAVSILLLIGLAIPPAIYHSQVQAKSAYCRQMACSLQPAVEHLIWFHHIDEAQINSGLDIFGHVLPAAKWGNDRFLWDGDNPALVGSVDSTTVYRYFDRAGKVPSKQHLVLVGNFGNRNDFLWLHPVGREGVKFTTGPFRPGFAIVTWVSVGPTSSVPGVTFDRESPWVGSGSEKERGFYLGTDNASFWSPPPIRVLNRGPADVSLEEPGIVLLCGPRGDRFSAVAPTMGLARQVGIYFPGTTGVR